MTKDFHRHISLDQRLWGRIQVSPTGCWEFMGARTPKGYGRIGLDGQYWQAHRLAWTLKRGPIPNGLGLQVCHRCDNPPCINPDHLFLGTNADNCRDRHSKGRTKNLETGTALLARENRSKTHCPQSHPYSGDNVRFRPNGSRYCAECNRAHYRKAKSEVTS